MAPAEVGLNFVPALIAACKVLKVSAAGVMPFKGFPEDDDVCTGTITEQGSILAHVLREILPFGQTATKLCAGTLGVCQSPPVNQYKFPFPGSKAGVFRPVASAGRTPFQHFSSHRS
ncbi:hypothetical protein B0H16DRAFT_1542926 [Mycena metata]|uniref:Uncharacterized protein n=1 Tax=Mycena metata TaxID=1033252 RepID=A0AAD7ND07_9AGAR|nr:hypothetical protein B0H16DRAFT_1542926 [Mycena metata]